MSLFSSKLCGGSISCWKAKVYAMTWVPDTIYPLAHHLSDSLSYNSAPFTYYTLDSLLFFKYFRQVLASRSLHWLFHLPSCALPLAMLTAFIHTPLHLHSKLSYQGALSDSCISFLGCHSKVMQAGWLNNKNVVSQFQSPEVQNQGACSVGLCWGL